MEKIAINCTEFSDTAKQQVQEAFFEMGYNWGVPGYEYRNLEANGYAVSAGSTISFFLHPMDKNDELSFPDYNFVTFNELMELAGCPWRMVDDGEVWKEMEFKVTGERVKNFEVHDQPLMDDDIEVKSVDNIAINCTGFTEIQKQYVQEAFFKMGYNWGVPGYRNLEANGYAIDNHHFCHIISPISNHDELAWDEFRFITFNELMEKAGCPWRMTDDGALCQSDKSEQTYNCVKGLKIHDRALSTDEIKSLGTDETHTTKIDRTKSRNKYDREIVPGVFVDVYDVLGAFKTDSPAVDHAVKKLLAPGKRGHKDRVTDLKEAIASIESEIAKINEWSSQDEQA